MTAINQTKTKPLQLPLAKPARKKKRLARIADRRIEGSFLMLPAGLLRHPQVHALSVHAKSLLLALIAQIRIGNEGPKNNGNLSMTYAMMRSNYGFRSPLTLQKAKNELIANQIVIETRKGGRHKCTLLALTCFAINECEGKMDCSPTDRPPCIWSGERIEPRIKIPTTADVSMPRIRRYKGTLIDQVVLGVNQSEQIH